MYTVSTKSKPNLKFVNKFPSNVSDSINVNNMAQ